MGIKGHSINLLKSYLTNRRQMVKLGTFTSDSLDNKYGVPQGSTLGPLLFNLFISDLSTMLANTKHILFADDLVITENESQISDLQEKLKYTHTTIIKYFAENGLVINAEKCNIMIFNKKSNMKDIKLNIDNHQLETVKQFKYLGVILDEKLTLKVNNEQIYKKMANMIYAIKRNRKYLNEQLTFKLITAMVYSTLNYGISIYYLFLTKILDKKLNRLFHQTLTLIIPGHPDDAKTKYKILDVRQRFIYFTSIFVYKAINEKNHMFKNYDLNSYQLRGN